MTPRRRKSLRARRGRYRETLRIYAEMDHTRAWSIDDPEVCFTSDKVSVTPLPWPHRPPWRWLMMKYGEYLEVMGRIASGLEHAASAWLPS